MASLFSESEQEWLDRRAEKLSVETGEPLPVARTKAMAQLLRLKHQPKAQIVPFSPRFRRLDTTL